MRMPDGKPEHYLQGTRSALTAQQKGGLPSGVDPFNERTVLGSRLDDGVYNARHLGGECDHRFAAGIRIITVAGDIAPELITEAIVPLTDGDTWVASQKVRRSLALPYFDSLVRPRKLPD